MPAERHWHQGKGYSPEIRATIVSLHMVEGLDFVQVAKKLGLHPETARKTYNTIKVIIPQLQEYLS